MLADCCVGAHYACSRTTTKHDCVATAVPHHWLAVRILMPICTLVPFDLLSLPVLFIARVKNHGRCSPGTGLCVDVHRTLNYGDDSFGVQCRKRMGEMGPCSPMILPMPGCSGRPAMLTCVCLQMELLGAGVMISSAFAVVCSTSVLDHAAACH